MVAKGFEIVTQGDVESPLQSSQQQPKNQTFQSLGRQSSIYSLTLDEFQQTLCEGGKKFGSMNMDEFLNSICTAEENQAQQHAEASAIDKSKGTYVGQFPQKECGIIDKGISKQPSITRQDSLSVPETFCRKTADEVWSEIHKNQQHNNDSYTHTENPNATQSQPTFGDMTLEDFLVQVGVTRAQNLDTQPPEQPPYGMHPNNHHHAIGLNFVSRPIMAIGGSTSCGVNLATYQAHPQSGVGEAPSYPGGIKTGGAYSQQAAVSDGGRVANGNEGLGQVHGLRTLSPASPVFSGGLRVNQVDGGNRLELDIGRTGAGQKQIVDGQVDKEVARRQRRMIKNRESAARSRARKQAYTVELEAELDQLKEENARLKLALAEFERRRKKQYYQEAGLEVQMHSKAPKASEKSRVIRRSSSCPY